MKLEYKKYMIIPQIESIRICATSKYGTKYVFTNCVESINYMNDDIKGLYVRVENIEKTVGSYLSLNSILRMKLKGIYNKKTFTMESYIEDLLKNVGLDNHYNYLKPFLREHNINNLLKNK
jgi:hypothetical protein